MNVNGSMQRPLQGISQQPPDVRNEGQCTWQENMQPNVVDGLGKRIGTHFIGKLPIQLTDQDYVHYYNRGDGSERYWVIIKNDGTIFVYDTSGKPIDVVINNSSNLYLKSLSKNAALDIDCKTISDYTFICNNKIIPKWSATKSMPLSNTGLVPVLFADYGKTYSITVNGAQVASFKTPDGSLPQHIDQVDTSYVAQKLKEQIDDPTTSSVTEQGTYAKRWFKDPGGKSWHEWEQKEVIVTRPVDSIINIDGQYKPISVSGNVVLYFHRKTGQSSSSRPPDTFTKQTVPVSYYSAGATSSVTCERINNTLVIRTKSGQPFTMTTTDGRDGNDMPAIVHQVDEINKLPKYAPVGYQVQITGKGKSEKDRYWLTTKRSGEKETDPIIWAEGIAPEVNIRFDPSTMPQVLVREFKQDGTPYFSLRNAEWDDRKVGDDKSNPPPSFIVDSQPFATIGTYQNRLFMLAGESFIASQSNEFFNFFKTTAQTEEEDRVIDRYADTEEINYLRNYAALDGDLVLFSDNSQFVISGDKAITADNMNMRLSTQYKNNSNVKPATTGETVLFSYNVGKYVQIREFYTDSYTDTKKARPITEHVDQLISGNVLQLEGSTNLNSILVRTDDDQSRMFVYDYLWQGADKVQSAWWVFSVRPKDRIIKAIYDRSELHLIVYRDGVGVCLEWYDVGDPDDAGLNFGLRLDHKRQVSLTRDTNNPLRWIVDIPSDFTEDQYDVVIAEGVYDIERGNTVEVRKVGSEYVAEPYDLSDTSNTVKGWIGFDYIAKFTPTNPVIKDDKNNAYGLDRLTVTNMYVNYTKTGAFSASVKSKYGQIRDYHYSGRVMGRYGNIVGFAKLDDGQFPIPVRDINNSYELTLSSSSYLPFYIRNLEWNGMINLKGRRV